jgi:hypothetical protein
VTAADERMRDVAVVMLVTALCFSSNSNNNGGHNGVLECGMTWFERA